MSKELFTLMREQEIATNNFLPTKKQIQLSAKKLVDDIVEKGEHNLYELFAQSSRLNEALNVINSEIKSQLPEESFETFGIKGTYKNGGSIPNYDEDIVYAEIKEKLNDRKTLLDAALKTNEVFFDSEGIEVPKVSKTERKSSLAISF